MGIQVFPNEGSRPFSRGNGGMGMITSFNLHSNDSFAQVCLLLGNDCQVSDVAHVPIV